MRLRLYDGLSREEGDVAQPGGLAGQALALQEADKVDVIVRSRRIYVPHDAACTCRDAAAAGGMNCRIQLDVLALHQGSRCSLVAVWALSIRLPLSAPTSSRADATPKGVERQRPAEPT